MRFKSKILDHCWVCGQRFTDANPPGSASREDHHVIPVAYGGADGPLVSLCSSHHAILHRIAVFMKGDKPYFELLANHTEQQRHKILMLAEFVYNAEQATRNDPNKNVLVTLKLGREHRVKLEQLKRVYPQARGRADIVKLAIDTLYSFHFRKRD